MSTSFSSVAAGEEVVKASDSKTTADEGVRTEEHFGSRYAFWLSAIGLAAGFGNVWRFPYLCYEYGGLAFYIPYFVSLILVGFPVLILEMGLGQMTQGGQLHAFNAVDRRARFTGLGFLSAYNLLTFYPLLIVWSMIYMVYSFAKNLPWTVTAEEEAFCLEQTEEANCLTMTACSWSAGATPPCVAVITNKAENFFYELCNLPRDHTTGIERFAWWILLGFLILWIMAYFWTSFGARILGIVNTVSMLLPTALLLILAVVGLTLDGAGTGIKVYIGTFQFSDITDNADVWSAALGQALFSLSAGKGGNIAYSAHNPRNQNFVQDVTVVMLGDTFYAFISGLAVFSAIGHLSYDSGIPIDDLQLSGSGLAFMTYPVGLSKIPYPGAQILCVFFFVTLFLLGMTSVSGNVEAILVPLMDSRWAKARGYNRRTVCLALCVSLFVIFGWAFATDMGDPFLDVLDNYNTNILVVLAAGNEAVSAGFLLLLDDYNKSVGVVASAILLSTWVGGACLGALLLFVLPQGSNYIVGPVVAAVIMFSGLFVAAITCKSQTVDGRTRNFGNKMHDVMFENVNVARELFNHYACKDSCWRVPFFWPFTLKFISPIFCYLLFFQTMTSDSLLGRPTSEPEPYPWWVFFSMAILPGIMLVYWAASAVWPDLTMPFLPPDDVLVDLKDLLEEKRSGKNRDHSFGPKKGGVETPSHSLHGSASEDAGLEEAA